MTRFLALFPLLALFAGCNSSYAPVEKATAKPQPQPSQKEKTAARHKPRTDAKFDFYVLAMSWSPEHCAGPQGDRDKMQCGSGRLFDFVLHGLWPQYEKGWPEDCNTQQVDRGTVDSMLDIMPSPGLVRHEWSKHGTCSGMDAKEYFAEARKVFQNIKIPEQYQRPKLQVMAKPDEMRKRFAQANPKFSEDSFAIVCRGRYLQEVRVCMTTDLEPRACSKEVARNQCRGDEMIMRPVR